MNTSTLRTQKGATLVVGLIMLVLLTLVVTSAFTLSTTNLKAVGNMQFRDEAIAAANVAIERVISSDFTTLPVGLTVVVDIDQNGETDYTVVVIPPVCIQVAGVASSIETLSGVSSGVPYAADYTTVWDIQAQVSSSATGAAVTIRQGVRKRLTKPQYDASTCV